MVRAIRIIILKRVSTLYHLQYRCIRLEIKQGVFLHISHTKLIVASPHRALVTPRKTEFRPVFNGGTLQSWTTPYNERHESEA